MVKGDSFSTLSVYNAETDDNNGLQFWIEEIQMVRKEFAQVLWRTILQNFLQDIQHFDPNLK